MYEQRISHHHKFHSQPYFHGYKINQNHGPLLTNILGSFKRVMDNACDEYPRVYAQRVDLHLPEDFDANDTKVISRFVDALRSRIEADHQRCLREKRRVYPCNLRFHWVREPGGRGPFHYHVTLFLNRDWRYTLGSFHEIDSLAGMIKAAWESALGVNAASEQGYVHFCDNGSYYIDRNSGMEAWQKEQLFERASYGAKAFPKDHGEGKHIYGFSRN